MMSFIMSTQIMAEDFLVASAGGLNKKHLRMML